MDTIQTYINNMFQTLPQTEDILQLKQEMLANMEDKYNELKASGKSENEAIGIVISEFGNLDELLEEMHWNQSSNTTNKVKAPVGPEVSQTEGDAYVKAGRRNAYRIAFGVILIFVGIISMLTFSFLSESIFNSDSDTLIEGIGICALLAFIGIAVAIFIYSGFQMKPFEYIEHGGFHLNPSTRMYYEKLALDNDKKGFGSIALGVILCILSPIPVVLTSYLNAKWEDFSVCSLLALVAIAVFLFITSNPEKESYKKLLHNHGPYPGMYEGENTPKQDKVIGAVASIVWPFAALVFFVLGFVFHLWNINWIIWPITGILFGIFCSVYKVISSDQEQ